MPSVETLFNYFNFNFNFLYVFMYSFLYAKRPLFCRAEENKHLIGLLHNQSALKFAADKYRAHVNPNQFVDPKKKTCLLDLRHKIHTRTHTHTGRRIQKYFHGAHERTRHREKFIRINSVQLTRVPSLPPRYTPS